MRKPFRWSPVRVGLLIMAIVLVGISWWQVLNAQADLRSRKLERNGIPLRYLIEDGRQDVPGVVIAHGFGASSQIMLGYAYTLAHAGYGVMLLDFDGHAANANPFDREGGVLQRNLDTAYAALAAQTEIDEQRVALLGHSMGGGAVMQAGIADPDLYRATIAVSASGADVTPDLPRNLLLMPGEWEGRLISNSQEMLTQAGGANDSFDDGRARALVIVPRTEHILVLFSPHAHQTALDWLNRSFDVEFTTEYRDDRLAWFGVSLVAWMLLAIVVAPLTRAPRINQTANRRPWDWIALALMPFVASVGVAIVNVLWPVPELGGILVGGAMTLWFLILGLGWLAVGFRPASLTWKEIFRGLALFAFLWIAVGLMSQVVWLQWLLVPPRLLRWPLMALAFLPWLLAAGQIQSGKSALEIAGWWLFQTVSLIAGLILLVVLVPGLFVVILALPVLPLLLAVMGIAGAAVDHPWSFALGNAFFFGWQMAAYFPFSG